MIHVTVADPLPIFRAGVGTCLRREGDFEVTEAATLRETLESACSADVVLVDVDLPPEGGVVAVERLTEESTARIAVWSLAPDGEAMLAAVRAGASGFLAKEISPQALSRALRALARGEALVPRPLIRTVVDALRRVDQRQRAQGQFSRLSLRERQVLELVALGARNRHIAEELQISEFTVKRHVQNILRKLEVASRNAAGTFYRASVDDAAPPGVRR